MLLSSSPASPGLVVTKLVNMSVAMIELPKRYSSTIWNAHRKMNGNASQIIMPERRSATLHIM